MVFEFFPEKKFYTDISYSSCIHRSVSLVLLSERSGQPFIHIEHILVEHLLCNVTVNP